MVRIAEKDKPVDEYVPEGHGEHEVAPAEDQVTDGTIVRINSTQKAQVKTVPGLRQQYQLAIQRYQYV
jgi:hypothetical protein